MANPGDTINKWLFSLYDSSTFLPNSASKGYIDIQDLNRASEVTGVELTAEEVEGMVQTERNEGSGRVDFHDFKFFMEEEVQYL